MPFLIIAARFLAPIIAQIGLKILGDLISKRVAISTLSKLAEKPSNDLTHDMVTPVAVALNVETPKRK